jgi:drug/metabolite transporter (DMT)-like permease
VTAPNLARVVLWMSGALLSFCTMAVSIRSLSATLNVFEILAVRSGFGIAVLGLILAFHPALRASVRSRRIGTHLVRNATHYGGQYMWALSLTLMPLATVFALEFTMPAWTTLLAALLLGERMTPSRIGAVVLGLLGVLIILRPGIASFRPEALIVLAAAFMYAVSMIATKRLTHTETSFTIVFWMNAMQLPMSLVGCAPDFLLRLAPHDILPMLGVGISGLASHYCLTNAFRFGEASVVVPLDFMRIPLIALIGWWLFGEVMDIFVFAGALVIVAGVLWNLRAETRRLPLSRSAGRAA